MKKPLNYLASLLLLILLTSCGLTPPNTALCTEINLSKGYCVMTISSEEFEVSDAKPWNGKTWWELRPTMIYMPAESWAKIKAFIIKVCKKTGKCNSDISNWERTVKAIDEKVAN